MKKYSTGIENKFPLFSLQTTQKDKYQVLHVKGKMVYEHSDIVRKSLLAEVADQTRYIINTDGLEKIDSTGLGALISFGREVKARQGNLAFVVKQEFIREVFAIAKFNLVFPIIENEEKAFTTLNNEQNLPISLYQY